MGSPLASMLLAQAAPTSDALSGLTPEAQAALRALNGVGGIPEAVPTPAPTPTPTPTPQQSAGIGQMLMNWLSGILPGNKELAPQVQATPQPTPEELAAEEARKKALIGQAVGGGLNQ